MSIRYILTTVESEEIWAPVVICDYCDQQIIGPGNVLWDPEPDLMIHTPVFAHKGVCDRTIEKAHPRFLYWEELETWIAQLANNTVMPGHRVRPVVRLGASK